MGPEVVNVPLETLVSLTRDSWTNAKNGSIEIPPARDSYDADRLPAPAPVTAEPALRQDQGWFDNKALESAKH